VLPPKRNMRSITGGFFVSRACISLCEVYPDQVLRFFFTAILRQMLAFVLKALYSKVLGIWGARIALDWHEVCFLAGSTTHLL
jgi:hypothetical protein